MECLYKQGNSTQILFVSKLPCVRKKLSGRIKMGFFEKQ